MESGPQLKVSFDRLVKLGFCPQVFSEKSEGTQYSANHGVWSAAQFPQP